MDRQPGLAEQVGWRVHQGGSLLRSLKVLDDHHLHRHAVRLCHLGEAGG